MPGQFICLKMPLKFRKIRFNLYFSTFNLSSNATSILWGIFIVSILQKLFCGIEALISYIICVINNSSCCFSLQRQRVRSRDDYLIMKVAIYQRKRYIFLEFREFFPFLLFYLSFSREPNILKHVSRTC